MGDVIKVTLTIYNLLNVSLDKYTNVYFKCFRFCNWSFLCISEPNSQVILLMVHLINEHEK